MLVDQTSKVGCECVIAGGEWHPCREHDLALASMEATGGYEMDRVPLADAGFSLIRMQGAHTRESGAWHVTDSHLAITPRGKAPDRSTRTVTLHTGIESTMPRDRDCVTGNPYARFPRLEDIMIAEAVAEAREKAAAERAARLAESGNASDKATTRAGRKAQAEARKGTRRTAAQMSTLHNNVHIERQVMDTERMLRLANALVVGGDTWADRVGN